jgi:multicomponent Na+:H+ antiporter subunit D
MIELPLAILWIGAVTFALLDGTRPRVAWASVATLLAGLVTTVIVGVDVYRNGMQMVTAGGWAPEIGITLRVDMLGILFAVLSQVVLIVSLAYETLQGVRARVFPSLVLFMGTGLTGLFFTGDAFNFYVFFEISMISAYIMAGYGETPRQFRAAFTFTVVNLLGSVFFLIGIAAMYHNTGWLDMEKIAEQMPVVAENPAILSATIIFVALSIKLGLFPFHFWLPAVYTGTRSAVAAILSGALANIGTYGILRFGGDIFYRELEESSRVLLVLASVSIVYGGLQAMSRHSTNEVLAYSSIGQVGYILVAIAIGGQVGLSAAILYAVVNSLNKTLLFLSAGIRGTVVGAGFAIGAFSVAGVPPVGGFIGKLGLFRASVTEESIALIVLFFLGGALSFIYMFQVFRRRYWITDDGEPGPAGTRAIIVLMSIVIVGIGVWPQPLIELSNRAADVLPGATP